MSTILTVVVHGATGSQGLPVVEALVAAGHRVRAIARHPDGVRSAVPGAEPVAADLGDVDALATAYSGADAVVLQLPAVFDGDRALVQARAAAEAVRRSGVGRVVFNASGPVAPAPVGIPFVDARVELRRALEAGDAAALVVGPAAGYMENLSLAESARLVLEGTLAYPLPEPLALPWLATGDLAAHVASAIGGDETGLHVLAGPELLTGSAAAAAIGAAIGREVGYETIGAARYEQMLLPSLGASAAAGIAGLYAAAAEGPPPPMPDPAVVRAGTTTLAAWAAAVDWEAAAAAVPVAAGRTPGAP